MDALADEILAVKAIFPECVSQSLSSPRLLTLQPLSEGDFSKASITLSFPTDYPDSPPLILGCTAISQPLAQTILESSWTAGCECIYAFIDKLRELPSGTDTCITQRTPCEISSNCGSSIEGPVRGTEGNSIYEFAISTPIVDRKSTFVGRAIKVYSRAEAQAALGWLKQNDKKVAKATHNIVAWRIVENGILMQDNDDDGEDGAGSRLAHLLEIMIKSLKDVMVVVSRWYGGIMLYGDRFKHISNVGREALQIGGFSSEFDTGSGKAGSKVKSKKRR